MKSPGPNSYDLSCPSLLARLTERLSAPATPEHFALVPARARLGVVVTWGSGKPRLIAVSEAIKPSAASSIDDGIPMQRSSVTLLPKPRMLHGTLAKAVHNVVSTGWPEVVFQLKKGRRMWTLVWPLTSSWMPRAVMCISAWATANDWSPEATRGLVVTTNDRATLGELEVLTIRELDVLRQLGLARGMIEIGRVLNIRPGRVKALTESIVQKLHLEDRFQASLLAIWSGLVYFSDEEWERLEFIRVAHEADSGLSESEAAGSGELDLAGDNHRDGPPAN
jgi:DNA-binding CsgD family transcriptional regulator